mmetsp:Transcript_52219/g.124993  ORF Transcript_52219/g.124993 Transcript_52219/m.124993 type:complete len:223 (+) Transcript_52219:392-1060(+)
MRCSSNLPTMLRSRKAWRRTDRLRISSITVRVTGLRRIGVCVLLCQGVPQGGPQYQGGDVVHHVALLLPPQLGLAHQLLNGALRLRWRILPYEIHSLQLRHYVPDTIGADQDEALAVRGQIPHAELGLAGQAALGGVEVSPGPTHRQTPLICHQARRLPFEVHYFPTSLCDPLGLVLSIRPVDLGELRDLPSAASLRPARQHRDGVSQVRATDAPKAGAGAV